MPEDFLHDFAKRGREAQLAVNRILDEYERIKKMHPLDKTPQFRTVITVEAFILVEDLGPWDEVPTITNQPEVVCEILVCSGKLHKGQRFFYIDSDKEMAEIEFDPFHQTYKFCRFLALDTTDPVTISALRAWEEIQKYQPKKKGQ